MKKTFKDCPHEVKCFGDCWWVIGYNACLKDVKKSLGSQLASLRWKKEKPNPEYFKKIRAIGVKKQQEKKLLTKTK